jgi:glycosyltransferase involved in cell wall biosynthesis
LQYALAACLPLQLARGIQNKALEAMSMTLPVLATQDALVGIVEYPGVLATVANDADAMISAAVALMAQPRQVNTAGRACVLEHYNWDTNLRRMERFLTNDASVQ